MMQLVLCLLCSFQMGIWCHLSWGGWGNILLLAFDFKHQRLPLLSSALFRGVSFVFVSALRIIRGYKVLLGLWIFNITSSVIDQLLRMPGSIIFLGDKSPFRQQVLIFGSPDLAWSKCLPARLQNDEHWSCHPLWLLLSAPGHPFLWQS